LVEVLLLLAFFDYERGGGRSEYMLRDE